MNVEMHRLSNAYWENALTCRAHSDVFVQKDWYLILMAVHAEKSKKNLATRQLSGMADALIQAHR